MSFGLDDTPSGPPRLGSTSIDSARASAVQLRAIELLKVHPRHRAGVADQEVWAECVAMARREVEA